MLRHTSIEGCAIRRTDFQSVRAMGRIENPSYGIHPPKIIDEALGGVSLPRTLTAGGVQRPEVAAISGVAVADHRTIS